VQHPGHGQASVVCSCRSADAQEGNRSAPGKTILARLAQECADECNCCLDQQHTGIGVHSVNAGFHCSAESALCSAFSDTARMCPHVPSRASAQCRSPAHPSLSQGGWNVVSSRTCHISLVPQRLLLPHPRCIGATLAGTLAGGCCR
jgi:hypothetical protein